MEAQSAQMEENVYERLKGKTALIACARGNISRRSLSTRANACAFILAVINWHCILISRWGSYMRSLLFSMLVLTFILASCGGGGGTGTGTGGNGDGSQLYVSQINGTPTIDERGVANYSVLASGVSGITYFWSSIPESPGAFDPSNASTTAFSAWSVDETTTITIKVIVSASGYAPVTRTKSVTIKNTSL